MKGLIKKVLPKPRLSMWVLITWLLLNLSVSPGQLLLGGTLAIVIPLLTERFWPDALPVKKRWALVRYVAIFLWDVLVANVQVAWWVIGPQSKLRPRWLFIPLEIEHPWTITLLASTISLTPGTVSSHVSGDHKLLVVHCLHTEDEDATVAEIKERYERPLKEIFE